MNTISFALLTSRITTLAKKIPLDHILASTRPAGGAGRGAKPAAGASGGIDLNDQEGAKNSACAC